jgi:hypothetical protein
VGKKVVGLENDAKSGPVASECAFPGGERSVVEKDGTGIRDGQACEKAEQGGFSAAGRADEGEALEFRELGMDVAEDMLGAEVFVEMLEIKFQTGFCVRGAGSRGRAAG